jgi:hypothetical protein
MTSSRKESSLGNYSEGLGGSTSHCYAPEIGVPFDTHEVLLS